MSLEVFLWIAGILIPFAVVWCIAVILLLRNMKRTGDELMAMHRDANGFGFGTIGLGKNFREARQTQKELVHYLKWFVENQTGEVPPPPLNEK